LNNNNNNTAIINVDKSIGADVDQEKVDSVIPSLMSLNLSPPSFLAPRFAHPVNDLTMEGLFAPASGRHTTPGQFELLKGGVASSSRHGATKEKVNVKDDRLEIVEVERTNKTRREFAQVARDVTRENFEPPAGSRILFAYYSYPTGKKELIGVASFQDFNRHSSRAGNKEDYDLFIYDFYNVIHYIFILRDFRGFGYGTRVVAEMEKRFLSRRDDDDVDGNGDETKIVSVTTQDTSLPASDHQPRRQRAPTRRPVRVQASTRAVAFFEALGYRRIGIGKESVCCGTPLFRTLYNMMKKL